MLVAPGIGGKGGVQEFAQIAGLLVFYCGVKVDCQVVGISWGSGSGVHGELCLPDNVDLYP
jgi:hypothetical protein